MTRHGEYKVPGGKLVKVDFTVDGDTLSDVVVSGDFFLYPEETLDDIRATLEGMPVPADVDAGVIADRIRAGIDPSAELLGTSPEAIATAVLRALSEPVASQPAV